MSDAGVRHAMPHRQLGSAGPRVSALGIGCMGMSQFYGPRDDAQSIRTLQAAIEAGVDFIDTADVYGAGHNERLVGGAIRGRRERVVLATKFGARPDQKEFRVDGQPQYAREACSASLQRLGVECIDLYLLPAPARSQGPDRRNGRRDGGAGEEGRGAIPGLVGSRPGHARARLPGPSHRSLAERVLDLDTRSLGGSASGLPPPGSRLCRFQPSRAGLSHRFDQESRGAPGRRPPPCFPPIPGRAPAAQSAHPRKIRVPGAREGLHARAAGACLARLARRGHRTDSRYASQRTPRRKHRRAVAAAECRRSGRDRPALRARRLLRQALSAV